MSRISAGLMYGVLAGVLVAAIIFPGIAVVGLGVQAMVGSFDRLPADLRIPASAQASYVYANDGTTAITAFYDENRTEVPLPAIAPVMQQATVAAEDARFYQHGGVDLKSVLRALVANGSSRRISQGASTLTMQYVRNVLEDDPDLTEAQRKAATADTSGRKIQEVRYATALETKLSKQEILDRYLNIAYFGDGAYGIDAASRTYFSKSPSELTLAEAALLAGLVQSPDTDNPVSGDRQAALARRSYVLNSMAKMKVISAQQAAQAAAEPLVLQPSQTPNDCAAVSAEHNDWGFFCDYVRQWWDQQPAFGSTVQQREQALRRGGYRIVTSLDPAVQASALKQALGVYGYGSKRALPTAVVQPGTGHVLALAVNRHYSLAPNPHGQASYPNTVDQLVAGGDGAVGYQAGSTFKMFTMLAALESGLPLSTSFNAPAQLVTRYPVSGPSCGGYYCPANANPSWMDGVRTMWTGFGRSVNTYWVWLEQRIGAQRAVAMAQRLGITFRADSDAALARDGAAGWGAFTLGVADTTPLDLANAYATVAADGVYCHPDPVLSITDPTGRPVAAANPTCQRVLDPDIARAATDAARCPIGEQSYFGQCDGGTAPQVAGILGGRPAAGKTGSSEQNATETFVGFTPQVAAAAIAADPDNPRDHVGADVASAVDDAVARTLAVALGGLPVVNLPAPSTAIAAPGADQRAGNQQPGQPGGGRHHRGNH
jgi:membrane peptidoglycan carboxypeptidase